MGMTSPAPNILNNRSLDINDVSPFFFFRCPHRGHSADARALLVRENVVETEEERCAEKLLSLNFSRETRVTKETIRKLLYFFVRHEMCLLISRTLTDI